MSFVSGVQFSRSCVPMICGVVILVLKRANCYSLSLPASMTGRHEVDTFESARAGGAGRGAAGGRGSRGRGVYSSSPSSSALLRKNGQLTQNLKNNQINP